jgi:hypothetical protein
MDAGAATLVENFDAYGERLPNSVRSTIEVSESRSAALSRIGQGIFWVLVVVIVLARVFYFTGPVFQAGDAQGTKTEVAR